MKKSVMRYINKWVYEVIAVLLFMSVGFIIAMLGRNDTTGGLIVAVTLSLICAAAAAFLFMAAYRKAVETLADDQKKPSRMLNAAAFDRDRKQKAAADRLAEYNSEIYTFNGAKRSGNYELVYFAPTNYKAQCMLASLRIGDEIHVFDNYGTSEYTYVMDDDIPLPPKLVNLYAHRRVCRLYVYSIQEDASGNRAIEIMAAISDR